MLRSLCVRELLESNRWWMSFLRSLSALMIPPARIRLESFNPRRSNTLADLVVLRRPFPFFGPRRARPRTPDRRGGPCLGTSEERSSRLRSWNCFSCAVASTRSGHRARRHTESLACRRHRLFVLVPRSTSDRSSSEKPPRFLLVGSQPFRAPQSRVLDRELLVTDIDRPTLTRPSKPGRRRMIWPRCAPCT